MGEIINIVGETFSQLTVVSRVVGRSDGYGHPYWNCRCTCGRETEVNGHDLKRFKTQSCGCLRGQRRRRKA